MSQNKFLPQLQGKTRDLIFAAVALVVAVPNWYLFFVSRDIITLVIAVIVSVFVLVFGGRAFGLL